MPRTAAEKISKAVNRPLADPGENVPMYTPALPQRQEDFHVLAFAGATMKGDEPMRAILLSDSCAIDTALGLERGRRPQGRLLFAPIVPATKETVEALDDEPLFGRFPLEAAPGKLGWATAELRDCFMVDARDVRIEDRILTLNAEAAADLEVSWDACALRRGPLAVSHNIAKLAARARRRGWRSRGAGQGRREDRGDVADRMAARGRPAPGGGRRPHARPSCPGADRGRAQEARGGRTGRTRAAVGGAVASTVHHLCAETLADSLVIKLIQNQDGVVFAQSVAEG